jgi:hypothetical protein
MAFAEHATEALHDRRASGTVDLVAVVPRSRLTGLPIPVSARLRLGGHRLAW